MIDPHVHLRDWNQKEKETMSHGLSVASKAQFTTLFDMPNTSPTLTFPSTVVQRIEEGSSFARKVEEKEGREMNYCAYGGITGDPSQVEAMVDLHRHLFPRMIGLKLFAGHSTGNMGISSLSGQREVYRTLTRSSYKGVVAVHCEKESLMKGELFSLSEPSTHLAARPPQAEIASIEDQIALVKENRFKGTLHITHISTREGIEMVAYERAKGMEITCGATAHHALMNDAAMRDLGLLVKMNPPLREEQDRKAVFEGLLNGEIDWIESDHAPHTLSDKESGASGIPGFQGTLRLILALREAGIREDVLDSILGERVNGIFRTSFTVDIPSDTGILSLIDEIRDEYDTDPFSSPLYVSRFKG